MAVRERGKEGVLRGREGVQMPGSRGVGWGVR